MRKLILITIIILTLINISGCNVTLTAYVENDNIYDTNTKARLAIECKHDIARK